MRSRAQYRATAALRRHHGQQMSKHAEAFLCGVPKSDEVLSHMALVALVALGDHKYYYYVSKACARGRQSPMHLTSRYGVPESLQCWEHKLKFPIT